MIFTLEALDAKHGDALLLHYGPRTDPHLTVIDGGPSGVYAPRLKPRLDQLKESRSPDAPLPIDLLMVSHIDDDHIRGVLDLAEDLAELQENDEELPYDIQALWHNSFEDLTGADPAELTVAMAGVHPTTTEGALILASVTQGRTLRNQARALGLPIPGLVTFSTTAKKRKRKVAAGLVLEVLGPNEGRVAALRKEWQKKKKKKGKVSEAEWSAIAAEYVDKAVANLSSIVVLARADGHSMLLTGDARGDDTLAAIGDAGLFKDGSLHVDVLKLPHHGSSRNVELDFFERITADHYVISADGKHDNPDTDTLEMIVEARDKDAFTIHVTNEVKRVTTTLKKLKTPARRFKSVVRAASAPSVIVNLGEKLAD